MVVFVDDGDGAAIPVVDDDVAVAGCLVIVDADDGDGDAAVAAVVGLMV